MKTESREQGFAARRCGSSGHEITADGKVVAWTVDATWASLIVELLEMAEEGETARKSRLARE